MLTRRVARQNRRMTPRAGFTSLVARALTGGGPIMTITGQVPLPMDLTVFVALSALGISLVTVTLGGDTLLSGNQPVGAGLQLGLPGLLSGSVLDIASGIYIGNTYTLSLS